MIKTVDGKTSIEGDRVTLLSDFSVIAKVLFEECDFDIEALTLAIEVGILSKEAMRDLINSHYGMNGNLNK